MARLAEADDPRVYGDKTATLARLHAAGCPVPHGVALAADLLDTWTRDGPPAEVRASVDAAFGMVEPGPIVVRSSALGEDGPAASYAGLFVSHLDVLDVAGALDAIADIRQAARLGRVSAYRGGSGPPRVAVLLQQQVAALAAGVTFTADPVTGDRSRVVISAVRGLADGLVSGRTVPEDWTVGADGYAKRIRSDDDTRVLDPELARAVADLARRVEDLLGTPVDVEWTYDGTEVQLVQARPITVLPRPTADMLDGTGWQKDEAHYPEPYTPFGASLLLGPDPVIDDGFAAMTAEFGLLVADMESRMVGGEVYMRPVPVVGPRDVAGPPPPALLLGLAARVVPPLRARMRAARRAARTGLLPALVARWETDWHTVWRTRTADLLAVGVQDLDDGALLAHADDCLRLAADGQALHFRLFLPYVVALHQWAEAAAEHLGWDVATAMSVLPSPASVAGVHELRTIAREVPDADRAEVAGSTDPVGMLRDLGHPELSDRLVRWIDQHAWRTSNYDPGSPALAERPALIARLLADLGDDPRAAPDSPPAPDLDAAPAKTLAAYRRACRIAPVREDNVLLTDNIPLGLVRRWLVETSRRLVDRGRIDRRDDAAFLTFDEVRTLLAGGTVPDTRRRIARRRGEQAWTRAHPGPVRVGNAGGPPDVRYLPAAGRILNAAMLWVIELEYPAVERDSQDEDAVLHGVGAAAGLHRGPVRVVRGEPDFGRLRPGEVLVCPITTPAWTVLFATAGAIVTDGGGVLSHSAIVAREHGLPAVVATRTATRDLRDGDVVEVDGTSGTVRRAADVQRAG